MSIADNKAALTAAGIDVDSVMQRFMGSERLTEKFMKRFADDMTFSQLEKAVAAGDSEEAFRAAHTLKGVAGNLGMTELFDRTSEMTERFRAHDMTGAAEDLAALRTVYERILQAVSAL